MKSAVSFIFAVILAVSPLAVAEDVKDQYPAPFGLEWGMSKSDVESLGVTLRNCKNDVYRLTCATDSLPKNLSNVDEYRMRFSSKYGLVKVASYSNKIANDNFGIKGKERYEALKGTLIAKYGKPESVYEWANVPNKFYQCLAHNPPCGSWDSFWSADKDGVSSGIALQILALGPGTGAIAVSYESVFVDVEREERETAAGKQADEAL